MSPIVSELSKLVLFWANVGIVGRSNGGDLGIIPVGITIRSSSMVVSDDVIGCSDPHGSWGLISVEQTPRTANIDDQVVFDQILGLDGILDEDGVTHSVVSNVVLDTEVVHTVDGDSSVESVMDGVIAHVRVVDSANHVEMNWIRAKNEGLTNIEKLN